MSKRQYQEDYIDDLTYAHLSITTKPPWLKEHESKFGTLLTLQEKKNLQISSITSLLQMYDDSSASSTSSSDDSSSSSDEDEAKPLNDNNVKDIEEQLTQQKMINDDEEDSDEDESPKKSNYIKTQNEINIYDENYIYTPNTNIQVSKEVVKEAGSIKSKVNGILVVESTGVTLKEGTVLYMVYEEDVVELGCVFEIFGPVAKPLYTLRLVRADEDKGDKVTVQSDAGPVESSVLDVNDDKIKEENDQAKNDTSNTVSTSNNDSDETMQNPKDTKEDPWSSNGIYTSHLKTNPKVYCYPQTTQILDPSTILKTKGCDASNLYDEEVCDKELEYSDDEQERLAKSNKKNVARTARKQNQHSQAYNSTYYLQQPQYAPQQGMVPQYYPQQPVMMVQQPQYVQLQHPQSQQVLQPQIVQPPPQPLMYYNTQVPQQPYPYMVQQPMAPQSLQPPQVMMQPQYMPAYPPPFNNQS